MAKKIIKAKSKISAKGGKKETKAKIVPTGRVYVTATFNNTLITLTDQQGNALAWSSAGAAGFKGTRKSTPFAAITAMEKVVEKARALSMSAVEVYIKGPGPGRDAAVRALRSAGLNVTMIADVTPVPHNGPRAEKKRRV
ncbi:30S ribosomal protein S11 [Candidatus Daviesbacteria bacterium]|nr:30S ribosomal protein S11 [Candidatus Daviesbacteria bacterium]